ncbi:calcium-binding protein [Snodgrassella alvi]|uniref:calcium-binding protein n=1 Tax=Snodgrassella alvi TaxID=1196083 RepID=UPI002740F711|nr:hypothetical protein [Snodgrassella alvi]WLT03100.1 hypothetical protein RAM00_04565 [Snodgrassella alvi]
MSQPQILTKEQLNSWNQKIKTGNLSAIGEVYQILKKKGYDYAAWAIGVATGDSITGNGALEYMQAVAKGHKQILTQARIDSVRRDMALGYLAMLQNKLEKGHGGEDITYAEMYEFHVNVFNENGLDISYWTLYTPMSIIQTNASGAGRNGNMIKGDKVVESMWEQIRATKGEVAHGGTSVSLELYRIMQDAKKGYIYVDKITGDVSSEISIINAFTMDASIHSIGGSELTHILSKLENFDKLIDSLGYKKITISGTDQQKAQQWCRDTDMVATAKSVTTESLNHNIFNLSTHSWYRNYATMNDKSTGKYFINHDTSPLAQQQLNNNWLLVGGMAMTKWIMAAVLNEESINSSNSQITSVNDQNFLDKGLEFVFDSQTGHRQLVPGKTDVYEFKYQLEFIDNTPEYTLNLLKKLSEQGETDKVSIYLNALAHLNPIVILNPDSKPPQRTLADIGEDWIKARCWMIQEIRYAQASEFNQNLDQQYDLYGFYNLSHKRPRYQQFKTFIESIRKQYGFSETDTLVFHDKQTGQSWSTNPEATTNVHEIVMLADKNPGIASGGALSDILIGSIGDDQIIGGKGNDLLIGGAGTDNYYFNNGDGQDHIIDSDGNGYVYLNNKKFSEYKWRVIAKNLWQSEDDKWRLKLENSGDLNIQSLTDKNDSLTIRQWDIMHGNKLGIYFSGGGDPSSTGKNKILGDWRTKIIRKEDYFDMDENKTGLYYPNWKNRNTDGSIVKGQKENGFEDVIYGTDLDDEIYGMGGGDAIDGSFGNDLIFGGDGNDMLTGGGGSDTIKGGNGDDYIYANSKLNASNRYRPGERWQMPASGKELIYAGPNWGIYNNHNDRMVIEGITDAINDEADTGGDFLYGGDGNDYIIGSNLNDYIEGDSEVFEQGDDIVYGMSGNDHIIGGNGNDYLYGDGMISYGFLNSLDGVDHGDDYIDGGDGNDVIVGGGGNDVIIGGNGDDSLFGDIDDYMEARYHGSDTIDGGAGNDEIIGGGGDDYLHGGFGNDKIWGDDADKAGRHSELNGNDHIWGDDGDDYLDGGYGNDNIHGGEDNDLIFGGADNDVLYGDNGDDIIYGDYLKENVAVHGNDYIDGGEGNDYLVGGGGDDWIVGGEGNDTLYGDDCQPGFELNTVMAGDDYLSGGAGNDNLIGGYGNDTLDGGTGDDLIFGGGGCDIIYGGEGKDEIVGDFSTAVDTHIDATNNEYNDVIYAGSGDDLVLGQLGDDLIYGGKGNDRLYGDMGEKASEHHPQNNGNDTIFGESGNDYIDGGYGNDYLDGGADNDTIFGGGGNDLIYGGDGDDLLIGDASNKFDIDNDGDGDDVIYGGNGNDTIYGGGGNDLLQGDDGDDVIYGGSGDDKLFGGDGDDWLYGGKGNNYLNGGLGNDSFIFKNGDGITTIEDYSGKSTIIVDNLDQLSFTQYEKGIIIHTGILGDAIYLIGCFTDGRKNSLPLDQIIFTDNKKSQTLFDLFSSNLNTIAQKYNQIIDGDSTDNSIWGTENNDLIYGYTGNDILHGGAGNDYIKGGDGNDILYGEDGDDILNGGLGEDTLIGGSGNDDIEGGDGNDILYGEDGDDILNGGPGEDTLIGGSGSDILTGGDYEKDIYIFQKGHGHDTVNDRGEQTDPNNVIFENASYSQTQFSRTGVDLIIKAYGTEDSVTFTNYFAGKLYQNFIFNFTDKTLNSEDINKIDYDRNNNHQKSIIKGWKGKDILYGSDGEDELYGGDGDDELYGGDGNDELTGGSGYDIVDGGKGDDIIWDDLGPDLYIFQKGHGHDVIYGEGKSDEDDEGWKSADPDFENFIDTIKFQNSNSQQAKFIRGGENKSDLIIYAYGTDDSLTIADFFSDPMGRSFKFIFNDKTLTLDDIAQMPWIQTVSENNTFLEGWRGVDYLEGGKNDDYFMGLDGNDILNGYDGDDILDGGCGNDIINGGDGNDILCGNFENVHFMEDVDGDDILDGGSGNDYLYGNRGNDTLIGGEGNDYMEGGDWEKDYYIFTINHGQDVINDLGFDDINEHFKCNELIFKGSNSENAVFNRIGDNLIIRAYGENDSVTLTDFFKDRFHRAFSYKFDDKTLYLEDLIIKLTKNSGENADSLLNQLWNQNAHQFDPNLSEDENSFISHEFDNEQNTDEEIYDDDGAPYDKILGTSESETIKGWADANILIGYDGDDRLYGSGYYNFFNGGKGNDIMYGMEYQKDTYLFEKGHGQDIIYDEDFKYKYANIVNNELIFRGGHSENVEFSRIEEDLIIKAYGTDDSVMLKNFFVSEDNQAYKYIFDDKTIYFDDIPKSIFPEKKPEEQLKENFFESDFQNHKPNQFNVGSSIGNSNKIGDYPSSSYGNVNINIDSLINLISILKTEYPNGNFHKQNDLPRGPDNLYIDFSLHLSHVELLSY